MYLFKYEQNWVNIVGIYTLFFEMVTLYRGRCLLSLFQFSGGEILNGKSDKMIHLNGHVYTIHIIPIKSISNNIVICLQNKPFHFLVKSVIYFKKLSSSDNIVF